MEIFLFCLFAGVTIAIIYAICEGNYFNSVHGKLNYLPNTTKGFKSDKMYLHKSGRTLLALDTANKQLLVANRLSYSQWLAVKKSAGAVPYKSQLIKFDDVLKHEIIIDGQTVSSKSAGAALAGGLLFGTAGAVVGSNMGKTKFSKDVKSIKLKLLIKDVMNPAYELTFFEKPEGKVKPNEAQEQCQHWHDTLSVALTV